MSAMKKIRKKAVPKTPDALRLEEPQAVYAKMPAAHSLKDLTYNDFKKLADKVPFTQSEWSDILHISERTLQRYAKDNHAFAPINAERFMLMENVLQQAKITFGNTDKFYSWLKRSPYMLEGNLSMQSLTTFEGIQHVLTQLGRIQHGIFA